MLESLGFTREAAGYMTRACNVDSLDEVKWMDGEDDVEHMIKRVNRPGGTFTVGYGYEAVTTPHIGLQLSLLAENNLKLCVYFLKHTERVQRVPNAASITLEVVCGSMKRNSRPCWEYIKPAQKGKDGRLAYEFLFDHYLGPNNVGNMA
jgi:hypothetical protein